MGRELTAPHARTIRPLGAARRGLRAVKSCGEKIEASAKPLGTCNFEKIIITQHREKERNRVIKKKLQVKKDQNCFGFGMNGLELETR